MISPVKLWRNQKKIRDLLGIRGTLVSYTIIRVPLAGFENQAPYVVVLVNIGKRCLVGQLVDVKPEDVKLGLKVRSVVRRVREPDPEGIIPYGIKFVLLP